MSGKQFNGLAFDVKIGEDEIHFEKFSLKIEDSSEIAMKDGRPDGWLPGIVKASGELVMDRAELKKLTARAKEAGSWQDIEPFDILSYAIVGDDELRTEIFGAKIKLESVIEADKSSSEKTTFTIPFNVTSKEFVKFDSIPYIKDGKDEKPKDDAKKSESK